MTRIRVVALAVFCLVATGCVEGEVLYTVNPDGSAKVKFDIVTVKPFSLTGGPAPNEKEKSVEEQVREGLRPLFQTQGVTAWKDVSAEYLPNGKLKISGTAYVRKLADFKQSGIPLLQPMFVATRDGDALKLTVNPDMFKEDTNRKNKSPDEIKKLTDDELDKYIHAQLIEAQASRPILLAVFSQAKLKATYVLPGDVTASSGFADPKKVSHTLDGEKVISSYDKWLAKDRTEWRKAYRAATTSDPLRMLNLDGYPAADASATVGKVGAALFDYDKEVTAARDAYPALKKKFGFGDDLQLPTSDGPPKFPPPPK